MTRKITSHAIGVVAIIAIILIVISLLYYKQLFFNTPSSFACPECNVLVISMTNLRYDHVSSNGYFRKTTPNVDALMRQSIVFDNAFSHASWTLPETMSIYTSLYPFNHGVMNRYDGSTLSDNALTYIEMFHNAGYTTTAFTGGFDFNPEFGLTNRFDHFEECSSGQTDVYPRQNGPVAGGPAEYGELNCTVPKAIDWLQKNRQKKFFMHVQGFDAHCPFSQSEVSQFDPDYNGDVDFSSCLWTLEKTEPEIVKGEEKYKVQNMKGDSAEIYWMDKKDIKHLEALYDESIVDADIQVGKLIDELKNLGIWDSTIVIFTSEHGDIFGKNGKFMRGGASRASFYDDVIHIPLSIRIPSKNKQRIDGLVSHIDLFPTITEILGIQGLRYIDGISMLPLMAHNKPIREYVYAGSKFTPGLSNVSENYATNIHVARGLDWKILRETACRPTLQTPEEAANPQNKNAIIGVELYKISKDPRELYDLYSSESKKAMQMTELVDSWSLEVKP